MPVAFESIAQIEEQVPQIEEQNRVSSEHLEQTSKLEKQIQNSPESAEISDEITQIQCIVDRAKEFTKDKKYYLLLKQVEQAIDEINKFHYSYHEPLPDKIFSDLRNSLDTHRRSIKAIRKAINAFHTNKIKTFSQTAKGIKNLVAALEGNLEFLPYHVLNSIEEGYKKLAENIEQEGFKAPNGKGQPFEPGIKNSEVQSIQLLRQMISLIEKAKVYVLSTQSAEAKAIERIQNADEATEYITVAEAGGTIDLTKLNERLKKRGYNIQIPCEDSSAG